VLVTAAAQVAIALGIHRIASPLPPVVTGTIILVIGLGLLPSGVNLAAGGVGSPDFGAPVTLAVAGLLLVLVLVLTVVLDQFCRGLLCTVSVLIAVVVGYLVSIPLGLLDPSGVGDRPVVAVPTPFEFGVSFQLVAVLSMAVVGVVNTVDSVGTVHAVTEGGAGRPATVRELRGDRR
jgi:NCS2 family nucleobase:cation symporter-2